jgi:hypothetical protein
MLNKMTPNEGLMPREFDEKEIWEVNMGKERHSVSGKQAQILKDASLAGKRGLVFFEGFAVSLAHIVSMTRKIDAEKAMEKENRLKMVQAKAQELGI